MTGDHWESENEDRKLVRRQTIAAEAQAEAAKRQAEYAERQAKAAESAAEYAYKSFLEQRDQSSSARAGWIAALAANAVAMCALVASCTRH